MSVSEEVRLAAADLKDDGPAPRRCQALGEDAVHPHGPAEFGQRAFVHWKRITAGGFSNESRLHDATGKVVATPELARGVLVCLLFGARADKEVRFS